MHLPIDNFFIYPPVKIGYKVCGLARLIGPDTKEEAEMKKHLLQKLIYIVVVCLKCPTINKFRTNYK